MAPTPRHPIICLYQYTTFQTAIASHFFIKLSKTLVPQFPLTPSFPQCFGLANHNTLQECNLKGLQAIDVLQFCLRCKHTQIFL